MANIHHFKGFSIINHNIKIKVKMDRFSEQFNEAQFWVDGQIMRDMEPYMPHNTSAFINVTTGQSAALQGTGKVIAAAGPFGRYLYMGKVMVDSQTGKGPFNIPDVGPRFRKGAKLIATDRPLNYSNPKAEPHWFDVAEKKEGKEWVKEVKKIAGGG